MFWHPKHYSLDYKKKLLDSNISLAVFPPGITMTEVDYHQMQWYLISPHGLILVLAL
jgi:hypothetical protein